MAFPRPLAIVRGREEIGESLRSRAESDPAPHVRDAQSLLSMIAAANGTGISKANALQVPSLVRALNIYARTIAAFPLREKIGRDEVVARPFLTQPNATIPYAPYMMRTVNDLCLYDRAYWRVTSRTWDNFPASVVRIPVDQATDPLYPWDQPSPMDMQFLWNGVPVPDRDLIRFEGDGNGGWLTLGATVLNTALALEAATLRYAEYPLPSIILKNTGADLPASVVDELLDAWEAARTNRSTAYLNSTIDTITQGWSANDLQLVDAREAAGRAVARLCNLDPVWVGAGVPGSSLTYANRTDLYRQLLDVSLTPVMDIIAGRLSMNDVTPRGHRVSFDTTVFLRANPTETATLVGSMLPLRVISIDEARDLLDLPDLMDIDQNPEVI